MKKRAEISNIFCSFSVIGLWKAETPLSGASSDNRKEVLTMDKTEKKKDDREHKDRLFRLIFGGEDKSWTLSLYNAVNKSDYSNAEDMEITTLDEAIYLKMKNDVSFLIAATMNFYEHQSTFNPNMPLRMLLYAAGVYSDYMDNHKLDPYSSTLQRIPAPRMVVFYNGDRFFKDRVVMKLSDAFIDNLKGDMEIEVTMLNINYGSNRKLLERCRPWCDYSIFVATVRKYKSEGEELDEAIRHSIDDLADDSPIKNYLLSMEVSMISKWLTAEYSVARHEEHLREEGREEQAKFTNNQLRNMGMDLEKRSEMLGLSGKILQEWDNESINN